MGQSSDGANRAQLAVSCMADRRCWKIARLLAPKGPDAGILLVMRKGSWRQRRACNQNDMVVLASVSARIRISVLSVVGALCDLSRASFVREDYPHFLLYLCPLL